VEGRRSGGVTGEEDGDGAARRNIYASSLCLLIQLDNRARCHRYSPEQPVKAGARRATRITVTITPSTSSMNSKVGTDLRKWETSSSNVTRTEVLLDTEGRIQCQKASHDESNRRTLTVRTQKPRFASL
jgi:hypothetical protein